MSEINHVYEAWEERFVSEEKGKRVVHYYLRSPSGRSLLAAIGNERSCRHFLYVVSKEFIDEFGSNTSIDPNKKWKARRDVVDWLISLVRKDGSNHPVAIPEEHTAAEESKLVEPKPVQLASFHVGERVEVLCQDSDLPGCWFRCRVLRVTEKRLKVEHIDLEDVQGKLQEWVPASSVASPVIDTLQMRYSGRHIMRPCPPVEPSSYPLEVGIAVDAWWLDGWWEGVIAGVPLSGENYLHVYFSGEGKLMTIKREDIRISRDWVDNRWVEITPKPDIVSLISESQM